MGNLIQKPYKAKAFNKDELEETTEQDFGIHYITRTSENNGCELIVNKKIYLVNLSKKEMQSR